MVYIIMFVVKLYQNRAIHSFYVMNSINVLYVMDDNILYTAIFSENILQCYIVVLNLDNPHFHTHLLP